MLLDAFGARLFVDSSQRRKLRRRGARPGDRLRHGRHEAAGGRLRRQAEAGLDPSRLRVSREGTDRDTHTLLLWTVRMGGFRPDTRRKSSALGLPPVPLVVVSPSKRII